MEYFDLSTNIQRLLSVWSDHSEYFEAPLSFPGLSLQSFKTSEEKTTPTKRQPVDPTLLSVRQSICITGLDWLSLQKVKATVASLVDEPIALESLHVKKNTDVKDGAYLVPKVILVGRHCPGKKLIDDDGDEGQLDYIYDEICEMGADVFVIYLGLPRSIYKPMRHMVYHPRLIDLVFPQQTVLRQLAEDNLLVTLVQGQEELTLMQKNVLREWLEKPVGDKHPVYKAADYLSSAEQDMYGSFRSTVPDINFYSESEVSRVQKAAYSTSQQSAKPKKKKKERKKLFKGRSKKSGYTALPENDLMDFDEESGNQIEMDMYTAHDHLTKLSV